MPGPADPSRAPLMEARAIHKRFLGVHALKAVTAAFYPGEIVAVMGENGAGKSTLMKCLAGVHQPDEGEILFEGRVTRIGDVRRAAELGISFIHQELNLADNLSVGANIFLGREPTKGPFIDERLIRERTRELMAQLDIPFSPDELVRNLSIGHQQMVEIAKALSLEARILIMDEPTSSLSHHETERLFEVVRRLRANGLCVVFISHRLAEVKAIAERVIVLRDGCNSGELPQGEIEHDRIVSLMVGRDLTLPEKGIVAPGKVVLQVEGLVVSAARPEPVSFELRAGEIVGMAGLVGAGRTELARAIFGIDRPRSGKVVLDGRALRITGPRDAIREGLAFVPEDRKGEGLVVEMSVRDNAVLAGLERHQTAGFLKDRELDAAAEDARVNLNIKTPTITKPVGMLSGGNQQKVVLAKWILLKPRVFLLDEPTRGIDVMSKSEIYEVIERMSEEGAAVLFISSELEELLRISDRLLVMHEGRITGELSRGEMSEERVMRLATGNS